ncbi:unnamed protein product [Moneuplotes crassus]|uniref:Uncharacterized protein n=1 Tax=Euplotes crassus TaxID=5936 RepID=A0AAD1XTE8_EUPCR|nr:unnamed protein product [Moneuplotes crassus]
MESFTENPTKSHDDLESVAKRVSEFREEAKAKFLQASNSLKVDKINLEKKVLERLKNKCKQRLEKVDYKLFDKLISDKHEEIEAPQTIFQSVCQRELDKLDSDSENISKLKKVYDKNEKLQFIRKKKLNEQIEKIRELKKQRFITQVYKSLLDKMKAHSESKEESSRKLSEFREKYLNSLNSNFGIFKDLEEQDFILDGSSKEAQVRQTANSEIQSILEQMDVATSLNYSESPEFKSPSEGINYYLQVWNSTY